MRVKVEGLREIQSALGELSKATQKAVLKRALLKAAEPIVADAKAAAPRATGRLQESIVARVITGGGVAGKRAYHAAKKAGKSNKEAGAAARAANKDNPWGPSATVVHVGPVYAGRKGAPYAHLVEYGWKGHGPQPFMRPVWNKDRPQVLKDVAPLLWAEIKRAVERKAKRDARKAAAG